MTNLPQLTFLSEMKHRPGDIATQVLAIRIMKAPRQVLLSQEDNESTGTVASCYRGGFQPVSVFCAHYSAPLLDQSRIKVDNSQIGFLSPEFAPKHVGLIRGQNSAGDVRPVARMNARATARGNATAPVNTAVCRTHIVPGQKKMKARPMSFLRYSLLAVALGLTLSSARAQIRGKNHVDEPHAYQFKIPTSPKKWEQVPISVGESTIIAKYVSPKAYRAKKKADIDFMLEAHKPILQVIYLAKNSKCRDYHQYLQASSRYGFHLIKEKRVKIREDEYADFCAYRISVKTVNRQLLAWTFHRDGARYILEFEFIEDREASLAKICEKAAKSFQFAGNAKIAGVTSSKGTKSEIDEDSKPQELDLRKKWLDTPIKERESQRKTKEAIATRRVKKQVPKQWDMKRTPHFLVISEHSPRVTKNYIEESEAIFQWMDKYFGDLSPDYVRRLIIRIFASQGSYNAYEKSSEMSHGDMDTEVTIHLDLKTGSRSGGIAGNIVEHFMAEKVPLWGSDNVDHKNLIPPWIREGFDAIKYAEIFGNKIKLYKYLEAIRKVSAAGGPLKARELMTMTQVDFARLDGGERSLVSTQYETLFRILIDKNGSGKLRNFMPKYISIAAEEVDKYLFEKRARAKKQEEERDESTSQREKARARIRHQEKEREEMAQLIVRINNRAFAKWNESDWKKLDARLKSEIR